MSKLAVLDDLLELYNQFEYHRQPEIFTRLQEVQLWQKQRMQRTMPRILPKKTMC